MAWVYLYHPGDKNLCSSLSTANYNSEFLGIFLFSSSTWKTLCFVVPGVHVLNEEWETLWFTLKLRVSPMASNFFNIVQCNETLSFVGKVKLCLCSSFPSFDAWLLKPVDWFKMAASLRTNHVLGQAHLSALQSPELYDWENSVSTGSGYGIR